MAACFLAYQGISKNQWLFPAKTHVNDLEVFSTEGVLSYSEFLTDIKVGMLYPQGDLQRFQDFLLVKPEMCKDNADCKWLG